MWADLEEGVEAVVSQALQRAVEANGEAQVLAPVVWVELVAAEALVAHGGVEGYVAGFGRNGGERLTELGQERVHVRAVRGVVDLDLSAEKAVVLEQLERNGCHAGAARAGMYTMGALLRHGTDEQKQRFLPKIASGELRLQSFGVTEPDAGSDTTRIKTFAVRDGDEYVVNGNKIFISRVQHSDLLLLLTRTKKREDATKPSDGFTVLLVDLKAAIASGQIQVSPIRTMVNHSTTEVFFENARVPASSLIGEEGNGFRYILSGMNAERILIAAECIGDAKWFLDKGAAYARDRVVFGTPIGKNQGVQFPLARAFAHMIAAEAIVYRAASLYDEGRDPGIEANAAKMLAADASWEAAEACMQTHGGFGFAREYHVERRWREARIHRTAPISTNLVLAYIGEHVLGMPRSY